MRLWDLGIGDWEDWGSGDSGGWKDQGIGESEGSRGGGLGVRPLTLPPPFVNRRPSDGPLSDMS